MPRPPSILLALLLALAACASSSRYVMQTQVGERFKPLELTVRGQALEIQGHDGRLFVNGVDRGALRPGDRLALDANGVVYVNGEPRYAPGAGK